MLERPRRTGMKKGRSHQLLLQKTYRSTFRIRWMLFQQHIGREITFFFFKGKKRWISFETRENEREKNEKQEERERRMFLCLEKRKRRMNASRGYKAKCPNNTRASGIRRSRSAHTFLPAGFLVSFISSIFFLFYFLYTKERRKNEVFSGLMNR